MLENAWWRNSTLCLVNRFFETNRSKEPIRGNQSDFPTVRLLPQALYITSATSFTFNERREEARLAENSNAQTQNRGSSLTIRTTADQTHGHPRIFCTGTVTSAAGTSIFGNLHLDYFEYTKVTSCLNFPLLFLAVFALFWGSMWCSPSQETRVWKRIQHWYITPRSATTVPYSPAWIAVNDCLSSCWDGVICAVDTVLCLNHPSWVSQKTCNLDKRTQVEAQDKQHAKRSEQDTLSEHMQMLYAKYTSAEVPLKDGNTVRSFKGHLVGVKFIS